MGISCGGHWNRLTLLVLKSITMGSSLDSGPCNEQKSAEVCNAHKMKRVSGQACKWINGECVYFQDADRMANSVGPLDSVAVGILKAIHQNKWEEDEEQ